jgi:adenosylmethionine-8-amino-7-oxononanoate aminotransferase
MERKARRAVLLSWKSQFILHVFQTHGFAARVFDAAQRRGVLVYPMQGSVDGVRGDHLLLAPPAITTRAEIHRGISELRHAIREVHP